MQALPCKDNEMNVLTAGQRSLCAILALTLTMSGSVIVLAQATPRGRGSDNPPARQSEPPTRGGDRSPGRTSEPPAVPQPRDRGSEPSQPQRSSGGDTRPSDVPTRGGDRSPVRTPEPPTGPARERGQDQTGPARSSGGDSRPVRDTGRDGAPTPIVRGDRSPDRTPGPAAPPQRDNGSNGSRSDRADRPVTNDQRDSRAPRSGQPSGQPSVGSRDTGRPQGSDRNQPPQSFGSQTSRDLDRGRSPLPTSRVDRDDRAGAPRFTIAERPGTSRTPDRWVDPQFRERRWQDSSDARRFTWGRDGQRCGNGLVLRPAMIVADPYFSPWFQDRYAFYPHYYSGPIVSVNIAYNPWYVYAGCVPTYIHRQNVIVQRPRVIYVDSPVYVDGFYRPVTVIDNGGDYYLSPRANGRWWRDDYNLSKAIYNIQDAFLTEDIALLATATLPDIDVSIFTRGRYEYSLRPSDYLDMTRDFMRTTRTTDFEILNVQNKSAGVVNVRIRHMYRNPQGDINTTYLTLVMERLRGDWTITQVDTAPERG